MFVNIFLNFQQRVNLQIEKTLFQLQGRKVQCSFSFNFSTYGRRAKPCFPSFVRLAIKTDLADCHCNWKRQNHALVHFALIVARIFFTATAATTIRAILPFSLRLCEWFLYFQRKTRIKISNAISVAVFKPSLIFSNEKSFNFWIAETAILQRSAFATSA